MAKWLPYIVTLLLLCSCADEVQEDNEIQEIIATDAKAVKEDLQAKGFIPDNINAWQGNLDGKYPVLIWCKEVDSIVIGSLYYTEQQNATPVLVVGKRTERQLSLTEYLKDGQITGYWNLELNHHSAEGEWRHPVKESSLSVSMMKIDTSVVINTAYTGGSVAGKYRYYIDGEASGSLIVEQPEKHKITVSLENVGYGPAHNIGTIEKQAITLSGNKAIYSSRAYGDCSFEIVFFNGFAVIRYINDKNACGLGHNVFLDGTYIKTKNMTNK